MQTDKKPVYSPRQVFAGSFLGGPMAAAYFLQRNFLALGNAKAARLSLLGGCLFTVGIFPILMVLPQNFPNYVIPIAYSYTAQTFAQFMQLKKEVIAGSTEYCFASTGKLIGISIVALVLTLIFWVLLAIAATQLNLLPSN